MNICIVAHNWLTLTVYGNFGCFYYKPNVVYLDTVACYKNDILIRALAVLFQQSFDILLLLIPARLQRFNQKFNAQLEINNF